MNALAHWCSSLWLWLAVGLAACSDSGAAESDTTDTTSQTDTADTTSQTDTSPDGSDDIDDLGSEDVSLDVLADSAPADLDAAPDTDAGQDLDAEPEVDATDGEVADPPEPLELEILDPIVLTAAAWDIAADPAVTAIVVEPDRLVLTVTSPEVVQVGKVVWGEDYLRRITAVAVDGSTVTASTEHARLIDVIASGSFRAVSRPAAVSPPPINAAASFSLFPSVPVGGCEAGAGGTITWTPDAILAPEFEVALTVSGGAITLFRVVLGGSLQLGAEVQLAGAAAVSCDSDLFEALGVVNVPGAVFLTPIPLGPIVLPLRHWIEPQVEATFKVETQSAVTVDLSAVLGLSVGVEYDEGAWRPIISPVGNLVASADSDGGSASVSVGLRLAVEDEMGVFGLSGPFFGFGVGPTLSVTSTSECGYRAAYKSAFEVFGGGRLSLSTPFFDLSLGELRVFEEVPLIDLGYDATWPGCTEDTCLEGSTQTTCDDGPRCLWPGETCDTPDPCRGVTCVPNASCHVVGGAARCACDEGWVGEGNRCRTAACTSATDLSLVGRVDFSDDVMGCGLGCTNQACASDCVSSRVGFSASCADCYAALGDCAANLCAPACASDEDACYACARAACAYTFTQCAGVELPAALTVDPCPFKWADTFLATLRITADDHFALYVNGTLIDDTPRWWGSPQSYTIPLFRHPERGNVLAIEGRNTQRASGLDRTVVAQLDFDVGGGPRSVVTNGAWRVASAAAPGWFDVNHNDAAWDFAMEQGAHGIPPYNNVLGESSAWHIWSYLSTGNAASKPVTEDIFLRRRFYVTASGAVSSEPTTCP